VFLGELQHGVYDDECEDLNEDELNAFYGFDESPGQSDDDDSDGNLEELETDEEWMESEDEVINFPFIKSLT
jgi:hypothetical protein